MFEINWDLRTLSSDLLPQYFTYSGLSTNLGLLNNGMYFSIAPRFVISLVDKALPGDIQLPSLPSHLLANLEGVPLQGSMLLGSRGARPVLSVH